MIPTSTARYYTWYRSIRDRDAIRFDSPEERFVSWYVVSRSELNVVTINKPAWTPSSAAQQTQASEISLNLFIQEYEDTGVFGITPDTLPATPIASPDGEHYQSRYSAGAAEWSTTIPAVASLFCSRQVIVCCSESTRSDAHSNSSKRENCDDLSKDLTHNKKG